MNKIDSSYHRQCMFRILLLYRGGIWKSPPVWWPIVPSTWETLHPINILLRKQLKEIDLMRIIQPISYPFGWSCREGQKKPICRLKTKHKLRRACSQKGNTTEYHERGRIQKKWRILLTVSSLYAKKRKKFIYWLEICKLLHMNSSILGMTSLDLNYSGHPSGHWFVRKFGWC